MNGGENKEKGSCAAGVVVFSQDLLRVVLVESKRADNWCPPKGSRERGETTTQTALRELHEESGLQAEQIQLIDDCFLDEKTIKDTVSTRYRVARVRSTEASLPSLSCDNSDEILQQRWLPLDDARRLLKPSRQVVLDDAIAAAAVAFGIANQ
jgi:8-oxo-dGTP pyrophosphatase MutT (NUDIX family)